MQDALPNGWHDTGRNPPHESSELESFGAESWTVVYDPENPDAWIQADSVSIKEQR